MKLKLHLSTGYVGATHEDEIEIDKEELEDLTSAEKDKYLAQIAEEWSWNHIELDWYLEEE